MPRTILVHLSLDVPDDDPRTADEIARFVDDALTVGTEGHEGADGLTFAVTLAEEI